MVLAMLGVPELLIVAVVVLLLFGPTKLPQLGSGIGKMLRGFKKEMKEGDEAPHGESAGEIEVTPRVALEGRPDAESGKTVGAR